VISSRSNVPVAHRTSIRSSLCPPSPCRPSLPPFTPPAVTLHSGAVQATVLHLSLPPVTPFVWCGHTQSLSCLVTAINICISLLAPYILPTYRIHTHLISLSPSAFSRNNNSSTHHSCHSLRRPSLFIPPPFTLHSSTLRSSTLPSFTPALHCVGLHSSFRRLSPFASPPFTPAVSPPPFTPAFTTLPSTPSPFTAALHYRPSLRRPSPFILPLFTVQSATLHPAPLTPPPLAPQSLAMISVTSE
jgi:hypothetical protein